MTETVTDGPYTIKALDTSTWEAFADFAERHGGVWGGCWCTWFHPSCVERDAVGERRTYKQRLVTEGRAHAALVFDGPTPVAWCQYGTVEELPNIYHRKEYEATADTLPDYRLTCLFVGKGYRRKGVSAVAIRGAVALIGQAGGGLIEAYPQDVPPGKKISASFLYNGTRTLFEKEGFTFHRPKGKGHCVMRKTVPDARKA